MATDFSTLQANIKGPSVTSTPTNKFANLKYKKKGNTIKFGKWTIGKQFVDKILKDSPYSTDWTSALQEAQKTSPSLAPNYDYYQSFKHFIKVGKKLGYKKLDTTQKLKDVFDFAQTIGKKLYPGQASPAELESTPGYTGLQTTGAVSPTSPGLKTQSIEPEALDVSGLTDDEGNALGQVKAVKGPTIEELTNQLKVLQDKVDNPTISSFDKSFAETLKPAQFQQKAQTPYQIKLQSGLGQYFGQKGLRIQSLLNK